MSEQKKVWVVQHYFGCEPTVECYGLLKVNATSIFVSRRGSKVAIRAASGRYFIYTEAEMKDFLTKILKQKIGEAQNKIQRYTEMVVNQEFSVQVIPSTPYPRQSIEL